MSITVDELPARIFSYLRCMDQEATTLTSASVAAGLSDYGRHARPELKRPQGEVEWSRQLAILLEEDGIRVSREVPYPARPETRGRKACDLVVTTANGETVWLEIKGAWRDYWKGGGLYRTYLLHPLEEGLDQSKPHTVPFDLVKLSSLHPPAADFVAELVVGFERPDDPMDDDIATLVSLAGLSEWRAKCDCWTSATVQEQRVRAWLWYRSTEPQWSVPGIDTEP